MSSFYSFRSQVKTANTAETFKDLRTLSNVPARLGHKGPVLHSRLDKPLAKSTVKQSILNFIYQLGLEQWSLVENPLLRQTHQEADAH